MDWAAGPCNASEGCAGEEEGEWLEEEVAGMRLWQLVGLVLSALLGLTVAVCCCVKFRIPRTKQEIEADHVRKRLARAFRRQLARISDKDMDEMDLRRALDCVRGLLDALQSDECPRREVARDKADRPLASKLGSVLRGMRARFDKHEPADFNATI